MCAINHDFNTHQPHIGGKMSRQPLVGLSKFLAGVVLLERDPLSGGM